MPRSFVSYAVLGALLVAPGVLLAQEPDIIVNAPRSRERDPNTGAPIEMVSTSRVAKLSDLDLNTPAGMAEAEKRVKRASSDACRWLDELYPAKVDDGPPCEKTTTEKALAELHSRHAR